jgi:hypothetical protein
MMDERTPLLPSDTKKILVLLEKVYFSPPRVFRTARRGEIKVFMIKNVLLFLGA